MYFFFFFLNLILFYEIAKLLVESNAKVNCLDQNSNTPITLAIKNQQFSEEMIRILVRHKADLNVRDFSGNTPLSHAFGYLSEKNTELIEYFIENKANLEAKNNQNVEAFSLIPKMNEKLFILLATLPQYNFNLERNVTYSVNKLHKDYNKVKIFFLFFFFFIFIFDFFNLLFF